MNIAPLESVASLPDVAKAFSSAKGQTVGESDFRICVCDAEGAVVGGGMFTAYPQVARFSRAMHELRYESYVAPDVDGLREFDLVFLPDGSAAAARIKSAGHRQAWISEGLRESSESPGIEALYRAVAQNLPDGAAFVVDRALRYQLALGQSLRDTGMRREDIEGRTIRELVPPPLVAQIEGDFRQALAGSTFQREHQVADRWFSTHGVPLQDDNGEIYAALAVSYDITAIKVAEQELRDSRDALQELSRRKDVFLATLAHELRNPLAPIGLGVELLRRVPVESEQAKRTYTMLRNQLSHISRLIEDLVDLAKVAEGKLRLSRELVSLHEVVQLGVDASTPLLDARGHTFTLKLPDHPVVIEADRVRMAQIVSNLLNNAAKFTPDGGQISLQVTWTADHLLMEVMDNGLGIPEDRLADVFEMFTQLETSVNEEARGGLGIGLALVKRLVELHGGTIAVRSEGPGKGSTFTVRIPHLQQFAG